MSDNPPDLDAELAACDELDYGTEQYRAERRFLHEHIIRSRHTAFGLPTNVRACYYVGVGEGQWSDDSTGLVALRGDYDARGERFPDHPRKISQKVSDWIGWLIEKGYVAEDEIVDELSFWYGGVGVSDLLYELLDSARRLALDPWSPNEVPVLLCEGRNDMSIVGPIADTNLCRAFPLGGMRGGSTLRWLAEHVPQDAPIGYVGDWNKAGFDIERQAERFLRSKGWRGTWTRIAVTDAQAVGLPHQMKTDKRLTVAIEKPSVETAALGPAALRAAIQAWLNAQRPTVSDADESGRAEVVAWLRAKIAERDAES